MLLDQICDALGEIEGAARIPRAIRMSPLAFERVEEEMFLMGADIRAGAPPGYSGVAWNVPIMEDASMSDDEFEVTFCGPGP